MHTHSTFHFSCGMFTSVHAYTQHVPLLGPLGALVAIIGNLALKAQYNKNEALELNKQVEEV